MNKEFNKNSQVDVKRGFTKDAQAGFKEGSPVGFTKDAQVGFKKDTQAGFKKDAQGRADNPTPGTLEFDRVSFGYAANRQILHEVSFQVAPGEKVAIVGASGAGKSTLGRLLFRFYDVGRGAVRVNGQDVRQLKQHQLRALIGVVPQDCVLFNDSIYNNIHYGNLAASQAQVQEAAALAQLTEFIEALPEGYDTQVGERGLKLSGGEKQRIAIARVMLKRPQILLFDEATSSLDSNAEQAILASLNQLARQHTTLAIAHRLSTITDADKILVLAAGRIIESGTHEQLLAEQGYYAELWRKQQHAKDSSPRPRALDLD